MITSFSFSEKTVGFILEGKFNLDLSKKLHSEIEEKMHGFDKINLYLEDNNLENFTIKAVIDECKFNQAYENRFDRIAMVTDRKWIKMCTDLHDSISNTKKKWFSTEDRMKAMAWIMEAK